MYIIFLFYFIDENTVLMDKFIFRSASYQRVYQYLSSKNLNNFRLGSIVEESVSEVLSLLLRYRCILYTK